MDELALIKAKQEITATITEYIDKKFDNEKNLIVNYIGWGARIAIAGLVFAVIVVGFFGWKSYDDINKSIAVEIKNRFDKDNPVNKYDAVLKEATVRGVLDSINSQITQGRRRRYPLDKDSYSTFLVNEFQDASLAIGSRISIVQSASLIPDNSVRIGIANSARHLFKTLADDDAKILASPLIELYASVNPNDFFADIIAVIDRFGNENDVVRSASLALMKVNKDRSDELIKKLSNSSNHVAKLAIIVNSIKYNDNYTFKDTDLKPLLDDIVSFGGDSSNVSLGDLLKSFEYIDSDNKNFWPFVSYVTGYLASKKYTITRYHDLFGDDGQSFIIGHGGSGFLFTGGDLDKPSKKIFEAFLEKTESLSSPTSDDLSVLGFWMIKTMEKSKKEMEDKNHNEGDRTASAPVSYIIYDNDGPITNETGEVIGKDRVGARCLLYIEDHGGSPAITITWRDASGRIVREHATKIAGLVREGLTLKETPGPSLDDEF